jgi:hypothetical protein
LRSLNDRQRGRDTSSAHLDQVRFTADNRTPPSVRPLDVAGAMVARLLLLREASREPRGGEEEEERRDIAPPLILALPQGLC